MEPEIVIRPYNEWVFTASAILFALFMLLESLAPRRELEQRITWRWSNNFTLGALNWYLTALAATWFMLAIANWGQFNDLGLLSGGAAGSVAGAFALLLATQFISYWIHRAFHRFSWLWPIHAVHHADVDVDVSTSYRHHPLEPLLTLPFTTPVVLLLGVGPEAVFYYRVFAVAATVFSHSNIAIPAGIERYLRLAFLTPDYHRVHHCSDPQYTNSNYGSLVPWLDYLFGTAKFRAADEQREMELGLEYLREPADSRLDRQLGLPLKVHTQLNG